MKYGIVITLLGSLFTSACDDGESSSAASCKDYCAKLEVCDDTTDQSGCQALCNAQRVRSGAYLSLRADCTEKLSCNVFKSEVGLMGEELCLSGDSCNLSQCIKTSSYDLKLTSDQQSYCTSASSKLNACDRTLDLMTTTMYCTDLIGMLSGTYLDEMDKCIQSECSLVASCLTRAAERYGTKLTMYPGLLKP